MPTIVLVRHAHAGVRGTHHGPDLERPLSPTGEAESLAIADAWAGAGVTALASSRATRCMDTLAPLAGRLGLPVEEAPALLEGTDAASLRAYLTSLTGTTVVCSHGDVIGALVQSMKEAGEPLDGPIEWPKASAWELHVEGGVIVSGRYHPRPEV